MSKVEHQQAREKTQECTQAAGPPERGPETVKNALHELAQSRLHDEDPEDMPAAPCARCWP